MKAKTNGNPTWKDIQDAYKLKHDVEERCAVCGAEMDKGVCKNKMTAPTNACEGCPNYGVKLQSERDRVLDEKIASRYKALLICCMDTIEDIRRKYEIAPKSCKSCSAYDLCEELRQNKTDPVFISCNTPAHAFRLDLKNEQSEQYCLWTEDDDGIYQTSCLHSFEFMNGNPELNGMKFCPYCGKLIRQVGEP